MSIGKMTDRRIRLLALLLVLVIGAVGLMAAYRLVTGQGLGLRSRMAAAASYARAVTASQAVKATSTGQYTNIIFLHHSTGRNLLEQGRMRELLSERGYQFWDQDYNSPGLRAPDGRFAGYAYSVPNDNTDPDGLAVVFAQRVQSTPVNTLSGLLQHEVIVFKSCFPNSNIGSAQKLAELKQIYLGIRDTIDQHPERVFVLLTTPPLNSAETNPDNARRARELNEWITSEEFAGGRGNLFVFDFYNLLAQPDDGSPEANMLKAEYREGSDSHPNQKANETIGPLVVDFIHAAIEGYKAD